jgi:hypothetical protein
MRTVARPHVAPATIGDASNPTTDCASWSWSCWPSDGAHSRSAAACGRGSPRSRACGCATKASTRPPHQPGSGLLRPSRLAPQHRSPLRTGRDHRRAQQRTERRRPRFEHPMLTIHQRPFPPEDRAVPDHWESQWWCQAAAASERGLRVKVRSSRSRTRRTSMRRRAGAMTAWVWVWPRFFR